MNFSKTSHKLGLLALFFATAFFAFYSVGGEKLHAFTGAPVGTSGSIVILQADGSQPPPPPPPSTKLRPSSATLA